MLMKGDRPHENMEVSGLLISLHLPKTGGMSFQAALRSAFGEGLRDDYADFPINTPVVDRVEAALRNSLSIAVSDLSGVDCIHGHFRR